MTNEELYHHGILGQKWGIRRYQNPDGTLTLAGIRRYGVDNNRTLKRGTEIQNISKSHLNDKNKKSNRIYASYTDSDKKEYVDMMGNYEYGERGYKNTFTIKKDIKIASERESVKVIADMYKNNPDSVSKAMLSAYRAVNAPIFFQKSQKYFDKKLSKLLDDPNSKTALKVGRTFLSTIPMTNKTNDAASDFYSKMIKKGFDAVLDTNDAYSRFQSSQDPLIIFNMDKLGIKDSLKLTKTDLDAISDYVGSKEFKKNKKDTSQIVHTLLTGTKFKMTNEELYHHGILGQKWGIRRYQNPDGTLTPEGKKRYGSGEARDRVATAVSNKIHSISPETKKKIAIGAGATLAVVGIGAYVATHPESITKAAQFVSNKAFDIKYTMPRKIENAAYKAIKSAPEKGKAFVKKTLKETTKQAKKIAVRAAGTVVLEKAATEYKKVMDQNKNLNPYAKAAANSVYIDSTDSLRKRFYLADKNNSGGNNISNDAAKKIAGEPASKNSPIDRQSQTWASFISSVPSDKKQSIKNLAKQGYSYDQLRKIANS